MPVVPNPRHGKLLALLDVTRGKLVNPAKKKNAPEYPTAAAGVGVLFRISFVVQSLAVFRTTHKREDDVSLGGHAVIQI